MFRYDYELKKWVPFKRKASYTMRYEFYADDDEIDPTLPDLEVEDIALTDEQKARLETVKHTEEVSSTDIAKYVFDEDVPAVIAPVVHQKAMVDLVLKNMDIAQATVDELEIIKPMVKVWEPDSFLMADEIIIHEDRLYRVRQSHDTLEHQPPNAEGMGAIYFPYARPDQITDYDADRNLAEFPYQIGELIRFSYGVYECKRVTNFSPQEYEADWIKRDDLT